MVILERMVTIVKVTTSMGKNKPQIPNKDFERHHLLFNRYAWSSTAEHNRLRSTKELIVPIKTMVHRGLHRAIEQVPLPDHHMIKRINAEFYPVRNDPIGTLHNLQEAVDLAITNPYTSDLSRRLGLLIVDSLQYQVRFIEEGME